MTRKKIYTTFHFFLFNHKMNIQYMLDFQNTFNVL